MKKMLENNIGATVGGLIVAFILGTGAMIYNNNINSRIFTVELRHMSIRLQGIQDEMKELKQGVKDRWTKSDQRAYIETRNIIIEDLKSRDQELSDRILKLESR